MLVISISGHPADYEAKIIILATSVAVSDGELSSRKARTIESMSLEEQIDSATIERLKRQKDFLLRMYQAELAKNPSSHATESARSNVIALGHTIEQIHGGGS